MLMRKAEILRLTALAFAGGDQFSNEESGINYALRQIAREEKGLSPNLED